MEVVVETEHQFWDEIQEIVSTPCDSEDRIDNALRSYLGLATKYKDDYLQSELDVSRCAYKLLSSGIFADHGDYVRRQMIYGLLQDDDPDTLLLIVSFLLFDGRQHEIALQMMNKEGFFSRLMELLQAQNKSREDGDARLHRLLMDLMYEMSRIQRVKIEDLVLVDDEFITGLFEIIEDLSYDVNDPYHYPVIRVLLVLNEQFMISAHDPIDERSSATLTNRVIKILSMHGNMYKTFGENIILLINREAETSLQLLTLKLLYLIFTTPPTYEYFYTNDLHVLVDILIRNLLDLPEDASALRHTYLRVLYPLLAHTQLKNPPHYKREELQRMLNILVRGQLSKAGEVDVDQIMHFDEVDETTRRLVFRCATVEWLRDDASSTTEEPQQEQEKEQDQERAVSPTSTPTDAVPPESAGFGAPLEPSQTVSSDASYASSPGTMSPTRTDESPRPDSHHFRKLSHAKRLGMHLDPASSSSLSVQEVAAQHEKPGVITPSRTDPHTEIVNVNVNVNVSTSSPSKPKIKPLPPKTRRWRGRRATNEEDRDRIPEETNAPSPSPLSTTPTLTATVPASASVSPSPIAPPQRDRRNSTSTNNVGLAPPPVPAHARRSASNPPPAVPPPRRSTHPAVQAQAQQAATHATTPPVHSPSRMQVQPLPHHGKHGQKPEPPRTRRAGRVQRPAQDKEGGGEGHFPCIPESPTDQTAMATAEKTDAAPVSVEEAVQNVSLE